MNALSKWRPDGSVTVTRWALMWRSKTKMEGAQRHIMFKACFPLLFLNRREAREYAAKEYGYILEREDLRREPHGWRLPKAVQIQVTLEPIA